MKKFVCAMMMCLLVLTVLAACEKDTPTIPSKTDPTPSSTASKPNDSKPTDPKPTDPKPTDSKPPVHTCEPEGNWQIDLNNHWKLCQCGEIVGAEAHDLDEDVCTVCSADFFFDDFNGMTVVWLSDENDMPLVEKMYDQDGTLWSSRSWEYGFYDNGELMWEMEYVDGLLYCHCTYDTHGNIVLEDIYAEDGSVEEAYRYVWDYDADGNPLGKKDYCNDVLYHEATFHPELGESCATEVIWYHEDGHQTRYEYEYDSNGNMLLETCYEDDFLAHELLYEIESTPYGEWSYLAEEYIYNQDGSYTLTEYDPEGEILHQECFDAEGNPINNQEKFDPEVCAPLFGTWYGTFTMTAADMGLEGFTGSINLNVVMVLDELGNMAMNVTVNPQAFLDFMVPLQEEMIYQMLAESMGENYSREELDAIFQTQHGMSIHDYAVMIAGQVDVDEMLNQETEGVYYVEGDIFYDGDSWTGIMESSQFTLEGDTLTLIETVEGVELTLVLTRGEPLPPETDPFDPTLCAPLFGTWEFTDTMTPEDMGVVMDAELSLEMTVQMIFDENGKVTNVCIADEDAYRAFMLEIMVEATYQEMEIQGMSREEVDDFFAQMGTTLEEIVLEQMPSINELMPAEARYYVEGDMLYMVAEDMEVELRFSVEGDVLTLLDETTGETFTMCKINENQ